MLKCLLKKTDCQYYNNCITDCERENRHYFKGKRFFIFPQTDEKFVEYLFTEFRIMPVHKFKQAKVPIEIFRELGEWIIKSGKNHLYQFCSEYMACYFASKHTKSAKEVAKIEETKIWVEGDREIVILFLNDKTEKIAKIIKAQRRRKLTSEQLAVLKARAIEYLVKKHE